jgi:hypothetical protein
MFHGVCCEGRFYVAKKWKNVPWGHDVKERSMFPKSGRIFHEAILSKKVPCDHILKNVPWGNVGKEGHIWPCRRRVFHVARRGKIIYVAKLGGRFRHDHVLQWKKPCTWRMFHMAMKCGRMFCVAMWWKERLHGWCSGRMFRVAMPHGTFFYGLVPEKKEKSSFGHVLVECSTVYVHEVVGFSVCPCSRRKFPCGQVIACGHEVEEGVLCVCVMEKCPMGPCNWRIIHVAMQGKNVLWYKADGAA